MRRHITAKRFESSESKWQHSKLSYPFSWIRNIWICKLADREKRFPIIQKFGGGILHIREMVFFFTKLFDLIFQEMVNAYKASEGELQDGPLTCLVEMMKNPRNMKVFMTNQENFLTLLQVNHWGNWVISLSAFLFFKITSIISWNYFR